MRRLVLVLAASVLIQASAPGQSQPSARHASRPVDLRFDVRMIDPGFSESLAVADFNKDGRLDILSAEHWYEAPAWTKRKIRDIPFNGSYIDNFSDLPMDVDGDGLTDIIQIAYFARRIVWLRNPGKTTGAWVETEVDSVGPTEFAFLVDLDNDGRALEVLPQFTGATGAPSHGIDAIAAHSSSTSSARRATVMGSAPATSTATSAPTSSLRPAGSRRPRTRQRRASGRCTRPIGPADRRRYRPRRLQRRPRPPVRRRPRRRCRRDIAR